MNPDFEDFLRALTAAKVRFVVVGAHALAVHGVPRSTGDIDILIKRSVENAERVWTALIKNKRKTGRLKDMADLEALGEEP